MNSTEMEHSSANSAQTDAIPPKSSRTRFKPQLSCTFCRSRKLKCDRTMPCENCVKRNLASSCTFIHATNKEKSQVQKAASQAPKDVQSQVRRLEELVISLMNKTSKEAGMGTPGQVTNDNSPGQSEVVGSVEIDDGVVVEGGRLRDTEASFGMITIDEDDRTNYVGSAHWAAILDNIAGLKDQLDISDDTSKVKDKLPDTPGPDLLVGSVRAATRSEIMATLPAKSTADKLIANFFASADMGSSMIHKPTFTKEYENFWMYPRSVPIMWIAQLYGILTMSVMYEFMTRAPSSLAGLPLSDPIEAVTLFREKTIQCLVLGNYTEPTNYTVETLFLYYCSAHFRSTDTLFGAWMIFALLIRAAMRLGYHRDASHYPNIPVFKGEMQRRMWASLVHLDLQTSLQVGLPRMIREGMYDTQPPRNLMDEDFTENTTVLPLPRPDHELTAIGCANVKHRITKIMGTIVDQSNWTSPISYDMVMKLDKQLHEIYMGTPPSLRVDSIHDLTTGAPVQRIRKVTLDLTFQKSRCILHRRFFFPSKTSGIYPYPYSMKSCIDASMRIMQMHILINEETQPGKALYDYRWRTSSLISHDFLLANMLICLHIGHGISVSPADQGNSQTNGIRVKWTQEEMLHALKASCRIWEELAPRSKEAAKACRTLKSMLKRVADTQQSSPASSDPSTSLDSNNFASGSTSSAQNEREGPNLLSSWVPVASSSIQVPSAAGSSQFQPSFDNTNSNMGIPSLETMDWELWESQVYNGNIGDIPSDLWNFDSNFDQVIDPGFGFTMWDQQL